jgi:hypothetical protein
MPHAAGPAMANRNPARRRANGTRDACGACIAQRNGRIHGCGALNDIVEIKHLYQNTGLV